MAMKEQPRATEEGLVFGSLNQECFPILLNMAVGQTAMIFNLNPGALPLVMMNFAFGAA